MKFIDLNTQYRKIESDIKDRIHTVLEHGMYINGPEVKSCEKKLAQFVGVDHCVLLASGTDAIFLPLLALGIGAGDEVIVPAFSFYATSEVVNLAGATPVFCDIDPKTYLMDISKVESLITKKTKAIMPVSLYGQCVDIDQLEQFGLPIIEDGAQSFGATYKNKMSCGLSSFGGTSFFPAKPLGAYGDAGALFTNNSSHALAIRELKEHGSEKRYHHTRIGINGRCDSIQAAVIEEKLKIFPEEVKQRQLVAKRYYEGLEGVQIMHVEEHNTCVYAQFTIEVDNREKFREFMSSKSIPTAVHYPSPLNKQPVYEAESFYHLNFENSQRASDRVVSLPMHPYLEISDQKKVIESVLEYHKI